MGYTVRSPEYRFTMWFHWDGRRCEAMWDAPLETSHGGHELYSHVGHTDPGEFDMYENANLANDPQYADTVKELQTVLLANFRGADKRLPGCPKGRLEDF